MRASLMMRWFGIAILGTIASATALAACSSSGTGSGTSGSSGCTPGAQQECACPGGTKGAQVCSDDGRSFGACDCGASSTTGGTGAGGSLISTGAQMASCGDGIVQPGECNPGEFYCAKDCSGTGGMGGGTTTSTSSSTSTGAGGACAGVVVYAGKVDAVGSVWASGHGVPKNAMDTDAKVGVEAGNAMCNHQANGSHVCSYDEMIAAKDEAGFKAIPAGTKSWVHRTTAVMIGAQNYPEGKGARCDDWVYATDHANDGEWADFEAQGVPTYHLDSNPAAIQAAPKDAPCGQNKLDRAILCCYPCP